MEESVERALASAVNGDTGLCNVAEYLRDLLEALWTEAEGFSGKRPFGNSGWQFDVYKGLIENGVLPGKLDDDGYVAECDTAAADKLIIAGIRAVFDAYQLSRET